VSCPPLRGALVPAECLLSRSLESAAHRTSAGDLGCDRTRRPWRNSPARLCSARRSNRCAFLTVTVIYRRACRRTTCRLSAVPASGNWRPGERRLPPHCRASDTPPALGGRRGPRARNSRGGNLGGHSVLFAVGGWSPRSTTSSTPSVRLVPFRSGCPHGTTRAQTSRLAPIPPTSSVVRPLAR
jgi:hypothetical protein